MCCSVIGRAEISRDSVERCFPPLGSTTTSEGFTGDFTGKVVAKGADRRWDGEWPGWEEGVLVSRRGGIEEAMLAGAGSGEDAPRGEGVSVGVGSGEGTLEGVGGSAGVDGWIT